MVQIDWNLLGRPTDIGGAALQGYTQGRQFAQQRTREDALARYAAAPSMDALAPIAAVDPQAYVALSKNERENAVTRRQDQARGAYSAYLRQNDPTRPTGPAVNALPDAGGGSPTDPVTGDVVVTARPKTPAVQEPRVSIADIAALDPEVAASLTKHMADLDKNERERFAQKTGGLSGFLCGRPLSSSDDEPLAEDDGELSFCLRPFAGWTFPLLSGGVEHEV